MEADGGLEQMGRGALSARRRRVTGVLALAIFVVFATLALLLSPLTDQVSARAPSGSPAAPVDATPTATSTPPAGPPTFTLVSPSSASGPVGARLTVAGDNWSGAVSVGALPSPGDCSNKSGWSKSFGSPKANSSGHLSFNFTWPAALATGTYAVCATNASGTASFNYQVLSASAPALAFSVSTAQVGTLLTINGSNFLGSGSITLTAQSPQSGQRLITTVVPLDNGSFSVPFTPTVRDVGTVTVRASSAAEGGAQSAISVSSKIKVVAAATATPTLAPTPTTALSLGGGTSTSNNSGISATAIVLGVVGLLFALLAIAGVVIFMVIRRRGANGGPDGQDPTFYGPGSQPSGYGSYDQTAYGGAVYGGDPTGAYSQQGQFGRSGYHDIAAVPPGQSVGGVAMWDNQHADEDDDDDDGPGPDWHPRPMTGHWRTPGASNLPSGSYDPGAVDPQDAAGFAPPDPWANDGDDPYGTSRAPAGNYGASGPGRGANGPSRGGSGQQGRNPWGESWRDAPQGQQGRSPRQSGNDDDPDDPTGYTGW